MGGRAEYAGFRGKTKDEFWTDPQLIADFEETIHFILTRTNTITGVRYCDDKSILCWETGNELVSPAVWTREIAHYIKIARHESSGDGRLQHLRVARGIAGNSRRGHRHDASLSRQCEIVRRTHPRKCGNGARAKNPTSSANSVLSAPRRWTTRCRPSRTAALSGGLLWSLRFRNRDGGFYWHSEPHGGNLYKAFHWPRFASGQCLTMRSKLMSVVRANAFAIRGLPVPRNSRSRRAKIFAHHRRGGDFVAGFGRRAGYQVERAARTSGDWQNHCTPMSTRHSRNIARSSR